MTQIDEIVKQLGQIPTIKAHADAAYLVLAALAEEAQVRCRGPSGTYFWSYFLGIFGVWTAGNKFAEESPNMLPFELFLYI